MKIKKVSVAKYIPLSIRNAVKLNCFLLMNLRIRGGPIKKINIPLAESASLAFGLLLLINNPPLYMLPNTGVRKRGIRNIICDVNKKIFGRNAI